MSRQRNSAGFTLIELMITVAIIAILIAVALPVYRNYVIRAKLVAGTNQLATTRAQLEQYYLDNRTYASVTTTTPNIVTPCTSTVSSATSNNLFNVSCTLTTVNTVPNAGYLITAVGTGIVTGAQYTVDQYGNMQTLGLPSTWGALPANTGCWIMRQGDSC
jgi:type IV pilus assembly protein PilE